MDNAEVVTKIYRDYWKLLYSICYTKTHDEWASEELVQNVFVGLCRRGGELEVQTSIKAYLIKSTKSAIIHYYKEKVKHAQVSTTDLAILENANHENKLVEHNLVATQFLEEDIETVVAKLPQKCQKVYRLSRENHLNTKEIAAQMKISPKTVKNH